LPSTSLFMWNNKIQNPKEIRRPKSEWRPAVPTHFGLRACFGFRISDFGFGVHGS
jgi:hypothetical protein